MSENTWGTHDPNFLGVRQALPSHQKHIKSSDGSALCGEPLDAWALESFAHAVNCILSGSLILPCTQCWAEVLAIAEDDPARFCSEERVG